MRLTRRLMALAATGALTLTATSCAGGGGDVGNLGSGETLTVITAQAPWTPAFQAVVSAFQEETGTKVDLRVFPYADLKTQLLNDAQTGSHSFDVYSVNEVDVAYFNANGLLKPLTDIDSGFSLDADVFTYDDLPYWNADTKTFGPGGALTTVPLLGNLQVMINRTDVFSELGLTAAASWDDAVDNAKAVVDSGAARYGFVSTTQPVPGSPNITYNFAGMLYGEGGAFFRDPGTDWTPTLNTPEALRAATVLQQISKYGPTDPSTVGQAQAIAVMQAGDSAQLDVVAAAAASMNDEANSNVVGKVDYSPLPGGTAVTGTWNLGIPADLPDDRQGGALDFVKWVTSEHGMDIFAENGGIPTRASAYDAPGIPEASKQYLDVVKESAATAIGMPRVEFSGELFTITEPILGAIAAGSVTPEEGLSQLQTKLTELIKDQGYPMAE